MSKSRAAASADGDPSPPSPVPVPPHEQVADTSAGVNVATSMATIGVIAVAAALIDLALVPGMIIGVAAAYAPKYVPQLGQGLEQLFSYTVRGAYKTARKAQSAIADVRERMHDLAAEVEAEQIEEANDHMPTHAAS
jgi:hypothetical protein